MGHLPVAPFLLVNRNPQPYFGGPARRISSTFITKCQMASNPDITRLLFEARNGNSEAYDNLLPHVYDQLREIAHRRLRQHRPGETLNTTALVHEAYLKLAERAEIDWQDRAHFFAVSSRAMRFILLDYARAQTAEKRGGRMEDVSIDQIQLVAEERAMDLLTLHDAVDRITEMDERLGRLIEYKFYGGLNYEEIAEVSGLSTSTLKRDWRRARTWLYRHLKENAQDDNT